MNSRQLARVGLGLIGVWALMTAISGFMTFAYVVRSEPSSVLLLIPIALLVGLSYVLVFHNSRLAEAIAPDAGEGTESGAPDLARVLVVLLGVHLLVTAIPGVLSVALGLLSGGPFAPGMASGGALRVLLGPVSQSVIAGFLIARPERLLEFVRRAPVAETP